MNKQQIFEILERFTDLHGDDMAVGASNYGMVAEEILKLQGNVANICTKCDVPLYDCVCDPEDNNSLTG